MNCYIGIDVGTSGVKSLLMDGTGRIVGTAYEGYDIIKPEIRMAEQDMSLLWQATVRTLRELSSRYGDRMTDLRGIGYSGQMHGMVVLDKDGNLLRNAIIWADQRSAAEIEKIYSIIGKDEYRSVALNSLSTGFMVSSLMWLKDHEPETFEKVRTVMFPKDYIRYRMCGEIGTEMTDASSGVVFDIKNRTWAWDIIDRLGFDRSIFPESREACEIAGVTTAECSRETGLPAGIPIAFGGGDTLMMNVGNGIIRPGILAANIGTSCQLSGAFNEPVYDAQFRTNTFCHAHKNLWLMMGAHLSGGIALKWLKNNMLYMDSYDDMTALASTVPAGSDGLVFLPYLSGERTPFNDPDARGIYLGMTTMHNRAHLIRSTMEGIIYGLRMSKDIMSGLGVNCDRIIAAGGGARGRLFLQMQADNFGCPIYTNTENEQACIGAALTAAVALGDFKDYEEACNAAVHLSDAPVLPDPANRGRYDDGYAVFTGLYERNKDFFHMKRS
ncbi:MAG: xylulokinase [Clostridia bacterium]|nr:xylulokinase [Clostridia bacterium]